MDFIEWRLSLVSVNNCSNSIDLGEFNEQGDIYLSIGD